MRNKNIIFIVIAVIAIIVIGFFIFNNQIRRNNGNPCKSIQPGEWYPQEGECQQNPEIQQNCNDFCSKHQDCCPGWNDSYGADQGGQGQILLPLPSESEISNLKRNYVTTIKAVNEGPNIYTRSTEQEVISEEKLEEMKSVGFNTVQVLLIGEWNGTKIIFNDVNNAVLLNDIVAIKNEGMAVWIALDHGGGGSTIQANSFTYPQYKAGFSNLVEESSKLMETYKVEYLTVNNEPDHFYELQSTWDKSEKEKDLAEFFPAMNGIARKNFNGKLINKITQPRKHTQEVIDASFMNTDIAGVDVGPPISSDMTIDKYKLEFADYQFYADAAKEKNIPWMNAEYWQSDFEFSTDYQKQNELKYAQVSFDAYLNTTPKGAGYTWNDITTLSWQPDGEKTKQAIKEFFEKI